MGEKVRGSLKLFVASIYHLLDNKEHGGFSGTLSSLVSSLPKKVQLIGGHDVNANLGVRNIIHKKVIGIYGIKNCNKNGRDLIGLFNASNLRVVKIFFQNRNYTTWRSFNKFTTPHMIDVITCSTSCFKYVNYCGATPNGVQSDQLCCSDGILEEFHKVQVVLYLEPIN